MESERLRRLNAVLRAVADAVRAPRRLRRRLHLCVEPRRLDSCAVSIAALAALAVVPAI